MKSRGNQKFSRILESVTTRKVACQLGIFAYFFFPSLHFPSLQSDVAGKDRDDVCHGCGNNYVSLGNKFPLTMRRARVEREGRDKKHELRGDWARVATLEREIDQCFTPPTGNAKRFRLDWGAFYYFSFRVVCSISVYFAR